jgi:hypothetical protein
MLDRGVWKSASDVTLDRGVWKSASDVTLDRGVWKSASEVKLDRADSSVDGRGLLRPSLAEPIEPCSPASDERCSEERRCSSRTWGSGMRTQFVGLGQNLVDALGPCRRDCSNRSESRHLGQADPRSSFRPSQLAPDFSPPQAAPAALFIPLHARDASPGLAAGEATAAGADASWGAPPMSGR